MNDLRSSGDSQSLLDRIRARSASSSREQIDLSLGVMQALLAELGNPQERLPPVVHFAGTNGKGSTLAFLKSILEAAGARVHAYTSPYLRSLHESILIGSESGSAPISEERLSGCLARVAAAQARVPATPFEAETAAALLAFSEAAADVVLLETGLGGRLDATNVVDAPALTIITPIAVDHAEFLGTTLGDIAREKAGILKAGAPVIVARQDDDAYGTIERYANQLKAPLHAAGRDFDAFEQHGRLVFQDEQHLRDLKLPALQGRHQIDNAGVAVAAALILDREMSSLSVTDVALERGLEQVSWPGRLERVSPDLTGVVLPAGSEIWVDGGHNAAAAQVLALAMAEMEEASPLPLYMVLGMLASKDADAFIRPFRGLVRTVACIRLQEAVHATAPSHPRSVLVGAAEANGIEAHAMSSLDGALRWIARQQDDPVRILICGSLHLVAEVAQHTAEA